MGTRDSQLQIRVTSAEKAALKRLAEAAGESVSSYVLARVLPSVELDLVRLYQGLAETGVHHGATLREVEETLERVAGSQLDTLPPPAVGSLSPALANCVAAMIESAAQRKGVAPPAWVASVAPLPRPHFGWVLRSLRPHQVRVSGVSYKRRNLFFDPAAGLSR